MGQEIIRALVREPDIAIVGGIVKRTSPTSLTLPNGAVIPLSNDAEEILTKTKPEVLVDFSVAEATIKAVPIATKMKVNMVIGTTGIKSEELVEIKNLAEENEVGVIIAPNFSLGAVIMIHLAKIASRYFDFAEIIEGHHHQKIDAPSGTALATARSMLEVKGKPFSYSAPEKETLKGTRGGEIGGIPIHSLRLPGLMARQEVVFGALGQTLTIRHDVISRECYIPGILLAIRQVVNLKGLVYGLEKLLGLEEGLKGLRGDFQSHLISHRAGER